MSISSDQAWLRSGPWYLGPLLAFVLMALSQATLAEPATIELTDGSTLRGEVVSLKGGAYEIATQSLGVIRIPQQDVALVSYQSQPPGAAAAQGNAKTQSSASTSASGMAALAQVQQRLMADPQTLAKIMALSDDAQVQAVIKDSEIQAAISRGDFTGLMQNPKIRALMEHPTIQQLSSQNK